MLLVPVVLSIFDRKISNFMMVYNVLKLVSL